MNPVEMGRKKPIAQTEPAASEKAYGDEKLDNVMNIIETFKNLPIYPTTKKDAFEKLRTIVNGDAKLSDGHKVVCNNLIDKAISELDIETDDEDDIELDYYGDCEISKTMSYTAKPVVLDPDTMNRFNALQTINMYCTMGMPCLVALSYGHGIFTVTSNITYEKIMYVAQDPTVDCLWFTDGHGIAVVK